MNTRLIGNEQTGKSIATRSIVSSNPDSKLMAHKPLRRELENSHTKRITVCA